MLTASLALAVALLFLSRGVRGPIWAASLAWIVCIAPIVLGLIDYRFIDYSDPRPGLVIMMAMLCFAGGAAVELFQRGPVHRIAMDAQHRLEDYQSMLPIARFAWVVGVAGGALLIVDFLQTGGASVVNLADLRESFVNKDSATVALRVASVMTWACLFSYVFALIFRSELGPWGTFVFALPVLAFLLGAVLAAGRQAAFQVIFFTIIGQILWRIRMGGDAPQRKGSPLVIAVSAAMVAYMGYIAIARNDSRVSNVKSEVLARLFDFNLAPWFDKAIGVFGNGIHETIVEGLVYFSSSIALFGRFLQTDLRGISYGAMDFPFLFRQLEGVTGINVADMYQLRVFAFQAQNVIGVGWSTTISNLVMDFGLAGAGVFLAVQGFATSLAWRAAVAAGSFLDCTLAVVLLIAAVYLPLIPAFSDNNILLLFLFCLGVKWFDLRVRQPGTPEAGLPA